MQIVKMSKITSDQDMLAKLIRSKKKKVIVIELSSFNLPKVKLFILIVRNHIAYPKLSS